MKVSHRLFGMIAAAFLLAATGRGEEEVAKVAQLGNPTNWQISGIESFDPQKVKRSLSRDFDVLLASHPQAPRSALSTVLRERLLEGYRSVGFASALVTVDLDEQRQQVNIHVTEGRRYQSGRVRVVGVDDELAEQLRVALTTEQLPEKAVTPVFDDNGEPLRWLDQNGDEVELEKPLWVEGKPAAFNDSVRASITRRLARTLSELGYVEPKCTHELTRTETTADLLVRIEDIGRPAVLREIVIVGNERNSRDEIIDYVKLRIGERFASADKRRILLALRASARFIEQQAETATVDASGGTKLTINLKELSVAPRLSESLTREDLALLKAHDWLTHGEGRELDCVVHMKTKTLTFDCVISPTSGVIATVQIQPEQATARPVAHAFIASVQERSFYNLRDKRSLILPAGDAKLDLTVGRKISDDQERPFRFVLGVGLGSLEEGERKPPIEMKTTMEPVYFLGLARLQNPVYSWDGDQLTVRTDRNKLIVDSQTGRWIESSFTSDEYGTSTSEYREGAFHEKASQLQASASEFRNEYDAERPVSSTLKYGCSLVEIFAAMKPDVESLQRLAEPNVVAIAGKLLDHGLLDAIDRDWVSEDESDDADDFSIPPSKPFILSQESIGRVAAALADYIFPRDTWPSNMLRESGFFLAGHREYTALELRRIMNDDSFGPIGHWMLAELMTNVSPPIAAPIAEHGQQRLSQQAFERDISLLTANCSECLNAPVRAVCSLSDEEVASLGQLFLDDPSELVRAIQLLRQSKDEHTNATLLFALGQLWSNDLQSLVSTRLRQISMNRLPRVANERTKTVE